MQFINKSKRDITIIVLVYLLVFIVFNSGLSINIPLGSSIYFAVLVGVSIFILLFFSHENKKFNLSMVLLFVACLISILVNDIPTYFKPYIRFLLFCLIVTMIGPLVLSNSFIKFRLIVFRLMNKLNVVICVLSLLGLITGIYKGITVSRFGTRRIDFTGLYNHSMTLGPMAGIAVLTSLYYLYSERNKKRKIALIFVTFISFITVITAGSRGALIATILGSLFFIYKKNQGRFSKYVSSILLIILILTATFPLWESKSDFLLSKMERDDKDDAYGSRTTKWEQRIFEFKSSPIFGIGFASINPNMKDDFNKKTGTIEPGSSWLAILSMTGIFGFIPLFYLFLKNIFYIFKKKQKELYWAYLGGLLILISIHMIIEGYIFASGAFLFFYAWLLLGVIEGEIVVKKKNNL